MALRKRLATATVLAVLMAVVGAAAAGASVERYQFTDYEIEVTEVNGIDAYRHTFEVRYDPSTDGFEGSGWSWFHDGGESLSAFEMAGSTLAFRSDYDFDDYVWYPRFALNEDGTLTFDDGYGDDNVFAAEGTYTATDTEYKNHGQFVKDSDDKKAAAHSMIGMPIQSKKNK